MSVSEVTVLVAQRAGEIEKAREIFTGEVRGFVNAVLAGVRRLRSEPWVSARMRIDLPKETENEAKASYLSSQYSRARAQVRFKKGSNFTAVAEAVFGIEYSEELGAFVWQIMLVPAARYHRIDDHTWAAWMNLPDSSRLPQALHQSRANTVRFVQRPLATELSPELAYQDLKVVLDFLISAESAFAEACGLDEADQE